MERLSGLVLLLTLFAGLLSPSSSAALGVPAPAPWPAGADVDYQLGGSASRPGHVGVIARDRTARPVEGRYNVCYVNGFQTQPNEKRLWRTQYWDLVLKRAGRPVVDEAWGEWLLDIRTPAKRAALAEVMGRWAGGCARRGFDAVEFDNLDAYTRSGGLLTRRQTLAYSRLLTAAAHRAGLAVGQKNLADLDGRRVGFDFAVAESCARWDECDDYVDHFGAAVLMIEYSAADFRSACSQYGSLVPVVLRDRALSPDYRPRYC
ncbi:endo alpha-1,4 polygalactosaminidase [Nocardioides sp. R-C-SC26]|uniref:endo alpha-1,4 polygalactosaminidase n=1 Tax=Nocardioides sp. R-C-SC26 TaxID=2870414 RepID=UPI001E3A1B25|nr:endo alpha-1,4 polygalactosaminidase [Nocardioides sp. R-C-SC26]